jgi:DNA-binding transcriptional MerR regulator
VTPSTDELVEYLDLQGSSDMVTKTELRQALRQVGLSISDRNMTYYTSLGLLPPPVRVGRRGGAYPEVVVEQLIWVIRSRDRGLSIEAIKELLPLWRWLIRARTRGCIDLRELELFARRHEAVSTEANLAIPSLVNDVITSCLCGDCLQQLEWILKDGTSFRHSEEKPLQLSFLMAMIDEDTGQAALVAWTQLSFPGFGHPDPGAPTSITLGLPVGVELGLAKGPTPAGRRCSRQPRRQREVLPLD